MITASRTWALQDAKARFSELIDACRRDGPQMVTRRGGEAAVVVSVDEWRRLQAAARPSMRDWLLAEEPRFEFSLPDRRGYKRRPPSVLE